MNADEIKFRERIVEVLIIFSGLLLHSSASLNILKTEARVNESLNITSQYAAKIAMNEYGFIFTFFMGFLLCALVYIIAIRSGDHISKMNVNLAAYSTSGLFSLFLIANVYFHISFHISDINHFNCEFCNDKSNNK